jgi:hypothetical protein
MVHSMTVQMFTQFALGTLLVVVCSVIHGIGLFSLSRAIRTESSIERLSHTQPLSLRGSLFTLSIVLAIVMLHGVEIWIFAFAYLGTGAIGTLEEALYYSTISYSTVGYSDAHVTQDWRLMGAFESVLGVILLGWSTAFFFRTLGRIDPH